MPKKRPTLKRGDVCIASKKFKRMYLGLTLVVLKVSGDTSDGRTRVRCAVSRSRFGKKNWEGKLSVQRRALWFTGRNINDASQTEAVKAKPRETGKECICAWATIMNCGCKLRRCMMKP